MIVIPQLQKAVKPQDSISLENACLQLDSLLSDYDHAEAVQGSLESICANVAGLGPASAREAHLVKLALDSALANTNLRADNVCMGLESVENEEIGLEGVKDALKAVGNKVSEIIRKIINFIKDIMSKLRYKVVEGLDNFYKRGQASIMKSDTNVITVLVNDDDLAVIKNAGAHTPLLAIDKAETIISILDKIKLETYIDKSEEISSELETRLKRATNAKDNTLVQGASHSQLNLFVPEKGLFKLSLLSAESSESSEPKPQKVNANMLKELASTYKAFDKQVLDSLNAVNRQVEVIEKAHKALGELNSESAAVIGTLVKSYASIANLVQKEVRVMTRIANTKIVPEASR